VSAYIWSIVLKGILSGLKSKPNPADTIVVDMTTSRPDLAVRIAAELGTIGAFGLDAPVSGGDVGAKEGRLSVMVGGDAGAFDRVKPILLAMGNPSKGGKVVRVGGPGSGQHTKMTNQILIATNMIGVVEGNRKFRNFEKLMLKF
jgi:3-hydroxyisobutyrate dehydrogenase